VPTLKTTDFTDVFHIWSVSSNVPGSFKCVLNGVYEFPYSLVMTFNFPTVDKQFLHICCEAVAVKLSVMCFVIKSHKIRVLMISGIELSSYCPSGKGCD